MTIYHHFNISRIKEVVIIQLVDYRLFDTLVVNELQDELQALLEEHRPVYLLVNFENVSQCSTSVINALLTAKKRLRARGGDVRLCQMKPIVPALISSSHNPTALPSAVRMSWRRDRPWTCCLRSDLIASLVSACGLAAGSTW